MKTVIIVQARMTSTRLPGKVLMEVRGKPLLEYQIERLSRVQLVDALVIATTVNDTDQPIVDLCRRLGISYFRGSEDDVLSRYYHAALEQAADTVVRITADCPLVDPTVVDDVIRFYRDHFPSYDYVANILERTYPRGMDTEVFSFQALEKAHHKAEAPYQREHVTPFINSQPQRFCLGNVRHHEDLSSHRWTVDTIEDFELVQRVIDMLYTISPFFSIRDIVRTLEKIPMAPH
ncbi:MAG TPA: glycosyltransferase family protein [Atribacteraceae bacterium]|nr:glycosyltransferase family protein [Atribacteraceae bacterium]